MRIVPASLALIGCGVSLYLGLYQYGAIAHIWEPFFGGGSATVLHAGVLEPLSRALGFPIHDAILGSLAYGVEMVFALLQNREGGVRAKLFTTAYCVVVIGMGLTSIVLVILQGTVFHAWCTLCLVSAAISEAIVLVSYREFEKLITLWPIVTRMPESK
ncbi:MAG TPA: vitamin K epoxide reductase family protein [Lacipirellulaceae bacterium]|jgi:hypothetical protein|nr:vitamin K epoxide reductase family protein [Lacipirellulaceae bacterium]